MSAERLIFLHVGTGKTGSSALQDCLLRNREKLESFGVGYPLPEMFSMPGANLESSGNAGPFLFFLMPEWRNAPFDEKLFLDNFGRMLDISNQSMIFSNEMLEYGDINQYMKILDVMKRRHFTPKLVYYVRNPVDHAFSTWRHLILEHGYCEPWQKFQLKYAEDFNNMQKHLAKFLTLFPRKDVILLNYSALAKNSIEQFFHACGLEYHLFTSATTVRESLPIHLVALILKFNHILREILGLDQDIAGMCGEFKNIAAEIWRNNTHGQHDFEVISLITLEELEFWRDNFENTIEWITTNFPSTEPLALAHPSYVGSSLKLPTVHPAAEAAIELAAQSTAKRVRGWRCEGSGCGNAWVDRLRSARLFFDSPR